jgi:Rad3-related DNA helicase
LAYSLSALRHVIQACGRSTRSADDYSLTYILDDRFPSLRWKLDRFVPDYFKESTDPLAY